MNLENWLRQQGAAPCVLGVSDCSLTLADWAVHCGYPDGAAHLRGTYATEAEMYKKINSYGDLVGVVEVCANHAGCAPTNQRAVGVIAVIGSPTNVRRQWGAIWNGGAWMVRLHTGFEAVAAHSLKMWKVL
ncbi:DUF6950 family protein [Flexibacterium corallicola]|uniref:DUF6950 family protein n=1 Tax=Flexibacterium corallicola TaxID=3037259 RepID=UPI00286F20CF|nr:hypothetical protein [Pseudovibrio sp. M1P-2-3]